MTAYTKNPFAVEYDNEAHQALMTEATGLTEQQRKEMMDRMVEANNKKALSGTEKQYSPFRPDGLQNR